MTARVALVTGAARGIGAATVDRLVADGYSVVAVDSCEGAPLSTREDLYAVAARHGDRVEAVVADVRDQAGLRVAAGLAVGRWGRLDAVVAAAAVMAGGLPLWETPEADLDLLWDVDAKGVWNTAATTIPAMLAGPDPSGCRFVALASAAGSRGLFHLSAYTAAKHAVVGIVRGLASDLAGTGVTACAVSPGSTDTAMLTRTAELYDASVDDLIAHQLIRRVLAPAEIAATIALCCSLEGAALNGSVVSADGGFVG